MEGQLKPHLVRSPVKHRYRIAAKALEATTAEILDVGGYRSRRHLLEESFEHLTYVSINVGPAWYINEVSDLTYSGDALPLRNDEYEYVISVDSLEHVPHQKRKAIVSEMVRVARKKAVLIVPFSLPYHNEETLLLQISEHFCITPMPSLLEHIKFGIPSLEDIHALAAGFNGKISFASPRQLYWSFQMAMLLNQASDSNTAKVLNAHLYSVMEETLESWPAPERAEEAYRAVITFDNRTSS